MTRPNSDSRLKNKFNEIKDFFEKNKCELLTTEYLGNKTNLKYKCPKGHYQEASWNSISKGNRSLCIECKKKEKSKRALTTEFVKEEFNKEGYTLLSDYKDAKTKVRVRCPEGHEFLVQYKNFKYNNSRCPVCYRENLVVHNKFTYKYVKDFIEKEGFKLLSDTYINNSSTIKIKCPKGHVVETSFGSFSQNKACRQCGAEQRGKNRRLDFDKVKEEFSKQGYTVLSETYKNIDEKLKVKCPEGHVWYTSFHNFKSGNRCFECTNKDKNVNRKYTYEEAKSLIENEGYRLISSNYQNNRTKLDTICPEGHEYRVSLHDFKVGYRCQKCYFNQIGESRKLSYQQVKDKFEAEGYKLLTQTYENSHQKLEVVCPNGHNWSVSWTNFANNGCRCSKCPHNTSKAELELYTFIKQHFSTVESGNRKIISPLELDIVIPEKKFAIEYCGIYWHSDSVKKDTTYHLNKLDRCQELGYRLITIFEDEWYSKKDMIKSRLLNILGISENERIYARQCEIKEIDATTKNEFLEDNHLQGKDSSLVKLGAFYKDQLVSVMTFSKGSISRNIKSKEGVYELSRFCSDYKYSVVGVASKLLKHFIRMYTPEKIYTYSDLRWSNGNLYKQLGFKFSHRSKPSYWYVKNNSYKKYHRFNFRKNVLKDKLEIFDSDLSEYENMLNNNYRRIWDCGNEKWILIPTK